jgi:hypothetical protein
VKAERLEAEFRSRAISYPGRSLLLEASDAIALVRRAAEEGVPILGVNCLIVSADRTEEPIDQIADYSAAVAQGHGCWEEAEAHIIARRNGPYVFALALGGDPVEAV